MIEHANSQKPPIACARLDPTLKRNSRLHQARVAFTGAVKGAVLLEQEQFADGQLGDTYIKSYNLRNFNNWQVKYVTTSTCTCRTQRPEVADYCQKC